MHKRLFALHTFFLLSSVGSQLPAQPLTNALYAVTVVDKRFQPVVSIPVMLREKSTGDTLLRWTDKSGRVEFRVARGRIWVLWIDGYRYDKYALDMSAGGYVEESIHMTHDPVHYTRIQRQRFSREALTEVDLDRSPPSEGLTEGMVLLDARVQDGMRNPLAGHVVRVVDLAAGKSYLRRSDGQGSARFVLPKARKYDIDVEGHLNASYFDPGPEDFVRYTNPVTYDRFDVSEKRIGDTIIQAIRGAMEGRHSKAVIRIAVTGEGGGGAGQAVYLNDIDGTDVYRARTDSLGEACFILPFGRRYLVHFPYQRNVDVVDLTDARGVAEGRLEIPYQPDPELEFPDGYLPDPKALEWEGLPRFERRQFIAGPPSRTPGLRLSPGSPTLPKAPVQSLLEIGVSAPTEWTIARRPMSVCFVLDVSGSMAGYHRIESLVAGLGRLLNKLQPTDVVSIVLYNGEPELLLRPTAISIVGRQVQSLMGQIKPSGSTALRDALSLAYRQAEAAYDPQRENLLVVMSDGWDVSEADSLLAIQRPYRNRIRCMTVGVGRDCHNGFLEELAQNGGGQMLFASEGVELELLLSDRLLAGINPCARDVRLELRPEPGTRVMDVFGMTRAFETAGRRMYGMPDIYPGSDRLLMVLSEHAADGADPAMVVVMHYTHPQTGRRDSVVARHTWPRALGTGAAPYRIAEDAELKRMFALGTLDKAIREMAVCVGRKDYTSALLPVEQCKSRVAALYPKAMDLEVQPVYERLLRYESVIRKLLKNPLGGREARDRM